MLPAAVDAMMQQSEGRHSSSTGAAAGRRVPHDQDLRGSPNAVERRAAELLRARVAACDSVSCNLKEISVNARQLRELNINQCTTFRLVSYRSRACCVDHARSPWYFYGECCAGYPKSCRRVHRTT